MTSILEKEVYTIYIYIIFTLLEGLFLLQLTKMERKFLKCLLLNNLNMCHEYLEMLLVLILTEFT